MVEAHSSNFRVITTNFLGVRIFRNIMAIGMGNMEIVTDKVIFSTYDVGTH